MRERHKVHALPTDKADSKIFLVPETGKWCLKQYVTPTKDCVFHHLYITSKDLPKRGDWVLCDETGDVFQVHEVGEDCLFDKSGKLYYTNTDPFHCKIIVATTNPDLYKGGVVTNTVTGEASFKVAIIPEDFIQAFVREQGIWEVELEMEMSLYKGNGTYGTYIPILRSNRTVIIHPVKNRMWTDEQVKDMLLLCIRQVQVLLSEREIQP
jgi:hypothetical protein